MELTRFSLSLSVDTSKAVKIDAREIIYYICNQDVVNMMEQFQKIVGEGR